MKIGCSLTEAFGEEWTQPQRFTEVPVQTFQNIIKDPYGSYASEEAFQPSDPDQFNINYGAYGPEIGALGNRMSAMENQLIQLSSANAMTGGEKVKTPEITTTENFKGKIVSEAFVDSLLKNFCEYVQTQEMENILLFILIVLFISNLLELSGN